MNKKFSRNIKLTIQFIRLALLSGIIFIIFMLIAGAVITYIYRDEAKDLIIQSLNRNLKTEIFVDNIQLDLFRRFPNASLTFEEVVALEVSPFENKDTLIKADRIYFQFNVVDLIKKNYKIKHIEISGGRFAPVDLADGTNNYIFWETKQEQPANNFEFDLQRIDLNDFEIDYKNLQQKSRYHVYLANSRMSGKFSHSNYNMNVVGKLKINDLVIEESSILSNKNANLDLSLYVKNNTLYEFKKGLLELGSNSFEIKGHIENEKPGSNIDLAISGKNIKLQNLINELPENWLKYFEGYRSHGELYFDALVKGRSSNSENPHITANFGIVNGRLNNRKMDLNLDQINFKAQFNNGSRRSLASSTLTVKDFSALINNGMINSNFIISDLSDPLMVMNAKADIEAPDFINLFKIEHFESASGQMLFDLGFESKLSKLNANNLDNRGEFFASSTSGSLQIKNVSFILKNDTKEYNNLNGFFHFNDKDLIINSFQGYVADNDFSMKGYFRNILPYFFHDEQRMIIDANFVSNKINLDELLQDNESKADTAYKLTFSDRVDFHLIADIGHFKFRKFEATNLNGRLQMRNKKFMATDILFNSMSGEFKGNAFIDGTDDNILVIGCDANLENVDVQQMFYQFGNFGQEGIKDENIKGIINAELQFTSNWTPGLIIDWQSLETSADIKIDNGELIEYKPMQALSRFLRVEDLEHVVFSELHNKIRIKDRTIIIPDMEINSSAVNIKLSGEHTFENKIDYRLQILLSELLAQKTRERRNPQEQYGDIIDDGLGRTTLFLRLTGTVDEPEFRYDYQGVREKLRDDLQQERQDLSRILREEFSWLSRDTLKHQEDSIIIERREEMERIKKQEEGEFVIEFDDL